MSTDLDANKGPWFEANKFCLDSATFINMKIADFNKEEIHISPVDFGNNETLDIVQDFQNVYAQLDHVSDHRIFEAELLKKQLKQYLDNTMMPKLRKLEMILLLQAFNLKGKPIIDVF